MIKSINSSIQPPIPRVYLNHLFGALRTPSLTRCSITESLCTIYIIRQPPVAWSTLHPNFQWSIALPFIQACHNHFLIYGHQQEILSSTCLINVKLVLQHRHTMVVTRWWNQLRLAIKFDRWFLLVMTIQYYICMKL